MPEKKQYSALSTVLITFALSIFLLFFPLKIFLIESNIFLYMKNKTQEIVNLDQKRGGVEEDLR